MTATRTPKPRTALVTGCAGFIGSHLSEELLARGIKVRGVDALTENYSPVLKAQNLSILAHHPNASSFEFLQQDLLTVDPAKLLAEIDLVFHLAGEPGVTGSWGSAFPRYLERNVLTTQRLLEAARSSSISRFVLASSSSVYGDRLPSGPENPFRETDPCRPASPYGASKLAAETVASVYFHSFEVPVLILRYFSVFGPRQRPDMAFQKFLRAAHCGESIEIFGDGTQSRDFTYVSDVVRATLDAAELGRNGNIYNVGGGCPASVLEVLRQIKVLFPERSLSITMKDRLAGDVRHTHANLERAAQDFGFRPRISLQEGLALQWKSILNSLAIDQTLVSRTRSDRSNRLDEATRTASNRTTPPVKPF